jgi:integrase
MPRRPHIPSYRLHKQSGQAVVTLRDARGNRRDVLLGEYGSPESRLEYARQIAEWEAANRRAVPGRPPAASLSLNEVILCYWNFARGYYGFDRAPGKRGDEHCLTAALRVLRELYGHTDANHFGPLALKACRQRMLAEKGWSRAYINSQVDRIRRLFRWAAEEELVPAGVHQALQTVAGLRKGKTAAREGKKVLPVSPEQLDAVRPFLPATVRGLIDLQLLTACRPTEVCLIRPMDVDRRDPSCWVYRPGSDRGPHGAHKTAHHGHDRLIFLGPRAQAVLRPFLGTKVDAYCFSPRASEEARQAARRAGRRTPRTPSQARRGPKQNPRRPKRDCYDETSYRNAVYRACDRAFPPPGDLARTEGETRKAWLARLTPEQLAELKRWQSQHRWHPNRLRHSRATELRQHGLDLTKTVLGHSKLETSQVYAEKDLKAAMELMKRIG